VANNNQIYKFSNAGGFKSLTRYHDMLAGNTVWNPWEPDGAYDALATVTVPSGGLSTITFAGIPNTYKHLQIRSIARSDFAGNLVSFHLRPNGETGANFSDHYLRGDGTGATASGTANVTFPTLGYATAANYASNIFSGTVIDLLDYANTNVNKTMRGFSGFDTNGAGIVGLFSAAWRNTAAINSLTIIPGAGNFIQNSQFTLYGVK
jgi:hypothetical protein